MKHVDEIAEAIRSMEADDPGGAALVDQRVMELADHLRVNGVDPAMGARAVIVGAWLALAWADECDPVVGVLGHVGTVAANLLGR